MTREVRFGGRMARDYLERELKFDIPDDFDLPDLIATIGTDSEDARVETTTERLEATYYDTASRHLQRARITLRRRRGGHDDGWHLKLPAGDARLEVRLESRSTKPPRELADLVQGIRFAQPLRPQVKLETHRVRHQLLDGEADLLEVAVDDVASTTIGEGSVTDRWRELEVELGPAGDDMVLRAVAKKLQKRGTEPSAHVSKYARAIGPPPRRATPRGLRGLVDDYLEEQREAIACGDLAMRRDENVVHRTRVAVRRTRSTLRVFRDVFDTERAVTLDAELRWYAGVLGRVRDLDIIRDSLVRQLDGLQDELVLGSARADVVSWLAHEREKAWKAVQTTLRGRRYRALLLELDRWRADPPWSSDGGRKRSAVLSYVAQAERKATKRLHRAMKKDGTNDDYHRARKAAKRWRYALELATPELGKPAKRRVKRLMRMQDDLGTLQDTVMNAIVLRRMALAADSRPGQSAFTYGVLYARGEQAAAKARRLIKKRYG